MSSAHPETIAGITADIANGSRTAREITDAYLAGIAALDGDLNAFTRINGTRARKMADAVDAKRAAGEPLGALAGVPIGVKDLIDEAGEPNTYGSNFPPVVPTQDATVIARLRAADAVLIGRTGLHEFAYGFSSENQWFGPVRNPWDLNTSPGGSSGGSAAAVAADLAVAALGTDTGGSVRVPAALCRIVGLKVTHGRLPLSGVFPLVASVDTVGPLTRTVGDAAAMYRTLAGFDPTDAWSFPGPIETGPPSVNISDMTIGVPHPWVDEDVDAGVAADFAATLTALAGAGATIVHLDLPGIDYPGKIAGAIAPEVAHVHRQRFADHPEHYGDEVRERMRASFDATVDDYVDGLAWRARLRQTFATAFEQCDLLATPTVAAMRKTIGVEDIDINGTPVSYRWPLSRFTANINHALLPAISVPVTAGDIGLQLIGPMWSEERLLDAGSTLEHLGLVGFKTPPHTR